MKTICDNDLNVDQVIEVIYPGLSKQRGKIINYLGIKLDYSVAGKVKIKMKNYVRDVIEVCSDMIGALKSPAQGNLFSITLDV